MSAEPKVIRIYEQALKAEIANLEAIQDSEARLKSPSHENKNQTEYFVDSVTGSRGTFSVVPDYKPAIIDRIYVLQMRLLNLKRAE